MVYLAEFALAGTMELADEILIRSDSEEEAQLFALHYASNWGIDLHSLRHANQRHLQSVCHQYWIPSLCNRSESHLGLKTVEGSSNDLVQLEKNLGKAM